MSNSTHRENLLGSLLLISGLVIGTASTLLYLENRPKKAGLILEHAKHILGNENEIEGSWIDYDPIEYDLFESRPLVYIGGISKREAGTIKQYQFVADIYTGEILDCFVVK